MSDHRSDSTNPPSGGRFDLFLAPFLLAFCPLGFGAELKGKNELAIKLTNLWPNRLIGDQKLPEKERSTWTSGQFFKPTDPLLPSGLLGAGGHEIPD